MLGRKIYLLLEADAMHAFTPQIICTYRHTYGSQSLSGACLFTFSFFLSLFDSFVCLFFSVSYFLPFYSSELKYSTHTNKIQFMQSNATYITKLKCDKIIMQCPTYFDLSLTHPTGLHSLQSSIDYWVIIKMYLSFIANYLKNVNIFIVKTIYPYFTARIFVGFEICVIFEGVNMIKTKLTLFFFQN
jgi:hypothetical protein